MSDWDGHEAGYVQTTPSGWEITYEPKPKRRYLIDGVEVDASVTTVLRCLDKPALTVWGERVGISAVLRMYVERGITLDQLLAGKPEDMEMLEWARLVSKGPVRELKLSTNDVRDVASSRGTTVHTAFEYWATSGGDLANPLDYPEHEQGYVIALLAFLRAMPTLEPGGIEVAVGSKEHSFAGRFDLRGETTEEHLVVTKVYPKAPPKMLRIPPGDYMTDLKTSVDIFPEHALQLGGYELASIESGYEPTDGQLVVQLGADGRYQCRRAHASGEDFLAVKACWEALNRATEGLKIPYRLNGPESLPEATPEEVGVSPS